MKNRTASWRTREQVFLRIEARCLRPCCVRCRAVNRGKRPRRGMEAEGIAAGLRKAGWVFLRAVGWVCNVCVTQVVERGVSVLTGGK